tara:strand:+ start:2221 stop:2442 length:222 start_codon:yes stop_codon:yes gene_type:complete
MYRYKGISFAKGFKMSLANFKKTYASDSSFLEVPHLERDAELERVWNEVSKKNGNNIKSNKKSRSTEAAEGKK